MVYSETVYCKECGKEIAFWDMFSNLQYEDEYECDGNFRKSTKGDLWKSKDGKHQLHAHKRDEEDKIKYPILVKSETLLCALYHKTKYCKSCARKLKYKCGRARCRGILRLVRRKDGKTTKHQHGGF